MDSSRKWSRDLAFQEAAMPASYHRGRTGKPGENAPLWFLTEVRMAGSDVMNMGCVVTRKGGGIPPLENAKTPGKPQLADFDPEMMLILAEIV
jgi:hypothetical protein